MRKIISIGVAICCLLPVSSFAGNPAPVTEPASSDVQARLNKLERLVQSQGLLDMLQQLDSLHNQVKKLRGDIELHNHTLEQVKDRQKEIYNEIDRRLTSMESAATTPATTGQTPPLEVMPAAEETPIAADDSPESSLQIEQVEATTPDSDQSSVAAGDDNFTPTKTMPEPVANADPAEIQAEYQAAFKLLKQSEYDQAIDKLGEFLGKYPDSEYSDNAQYWRAEAFYVTRRYEQAIQEYSKLVSLYPKSQKITHALLKMGYSHQELGQIEEAKNTLNNLKEYYPGTTAARLADDRLRQLNSTP